MARHVVAWKLVGTGWFTETLRRRQDGANRGLSELYGNVCACVCSTENRRGGSGSLMCETQASVGRHESTEERQRAFLLFVLLGGFYVPVILSLCFSASAGGVLTGIATTCTILYCTVSVLILCHCIYCASHVSSCSHNTYYVSATVLCVVNRHVHNTTLSSTNTVVHVGVSASRICAFAGQS